PVTKSAIKRRVGRQFHVLAIERLHLRASDLSYRAAAGYWYLDIHLMIPWRHEDRNASLASDFEEGLVLSADDSRVSIVESKDGIAGPDDERRIECPSRSKDFSGNRWQRKIRSGWPAVPSYDEREALPRSRS